MTSKSPQCAGFVYVMYWQRFYKIGSSTNPTQRIKDVSTSHFYIGEKLIIVGRDVRFVRLYAVSNMLRAERYLQGAVADKRIVGSGPGRRRGDWFRLCKADLQRFDRIIPDIAP